MLAAADALGVVRLGAAAMLPGALDRAVGGRGRWLPALLFALAAASDFLDGRLARRGRGPTRHGAVLDSLADIAFVLAGTVSGATLALVPSAVPLAIGVAFAAYAAASLRGRRVARSAAGHAAGVLNYALVGLLAGRAAVPGGAWPPVLALAATLVVGVNLAAVLERLVGPRRSSGASPLATDVR